MRSVQIYIFGAHGFIGAHLSQQLSDLKIKHFRVIRKTAMGLPTGEIYSDDLTVEQALSEIPILNQPCLIINCIGLTKFDGDNSFEEMMESNFEIPSRIVKSIEKNPKVKIVHLSTELVNEMNRSNREQYKLTKKLGDDIISCLGLIRHRIIHLPLVLSTNNKNSSLVSELKKMEADNYVPEIINPNVIIKFCTLTEISKFLISIVSNFLSREEISSVVELTTFRLTIKEMFEIRKWLLKYSNGSRDFIIQQIVEINSANFTHLQEYNVDEMNQVLNAIENI
jgi:nucleoside-diphosphate-sugar epimerase